MYFISSNNFLLFLLLKSVFLLGGKKNCSPFLARTKVIWPWSWTLKLSGWWRVLGAGQTFSVPVRPQLRASCRTVSCPFFFFFFWPALSHAHITTLLSVCHKDHVLVFNSHCWFNNVRTFCDVWLLWSSFQKSSDCSTLVKFHFSLLELLCMKQNLKTKF